VIFGYARVSTQDQQLDLQMDALTKAGCEQIYSEKVSGIKADRPELVRLLASLRKGDMVVVWKLDRLGRSIQDLISVVTKIKALDAGFTSLQDGINTATATGRFTFNVFASLAEFEREIIRERTMAGLAAARVRGKKGGRPAGLSKVQLGKAKSIYLIYDSGKKSVTDISKEFKIARSTCYRYIDYVKALKSKQ